MASADLPQLKLRARLLPASRQPEGRPLSAGLARCAFLEAARAASAHHQGESLVHVHLAVSRALRPTYRSRTAPPPGGFRPPSHQLLETSGDDHHLLLLDPPGEITRASLPSLTLTMAPIPHHNIRYTTPGGHRNDARVGTHKSNCETSTSRDRSHCCT